MFRFGSHQQEKLSNVFVFCQALITFNSAQYRKLGHKQYRGRGCDIGYSADTIFLRDRHRSRSML
jgi:hypothetical protein